VIRVSVVVDSGTDLLTLVIEAESILRALSAAGEYHRDGRVRVVFPIDPEQFFVGGVDAGGVDAGGVDTGGVTRVA
jgi:hypothetical protein